MNAKKAKLIRKWAKGIAKATGQDPKTVTKALKQSLAGQVSYHTSQRVSLR